MERISSNDEKYEVYVQLGMWRRAAEVANKMKDLHKLQQVCFLFSSLSHFMTIGTVGLSVLS